MKKDILFILFLFGTLVLTAQSNLKEIVGIVRPVYPATTVKFLEDFSKSLSNKGYTDASKLIDSYLKGGFGTGFVVKNQKGEFYAITNKHVVQSAEYVTVEFLDKRDTIRHEKCEVRAIDEQSDLALVQLPSGLQFGDVFTISDKKITDGIQVFTVGFPSLGNKPSWQFGEGIVSNSDVYDTEFTNDENSYIQHTAQIDPGSSGGPLLIKDKTGKFEVIGVNTLKARGRENANFSLPAINVSKFLKKYLDVQPELNKKTLEQQTNKFLQASSKNYKSILPYISYSYISNISVNNFYDLLNVAPEDVKKDVIKAFNNGMPIDGVRIAIASAIYNKFKDKSVSFGQIKEELSNKKQSTVEIKEDKKVIEIIWIKEQGAWKINNMPSLKTNELGKNGIAKDFGYKGLIFYADIPTSGLLEKCYVLSLAKTNYTFIVQDYYFGMASVHKIIETEEIDPITAKFITEEADLRGVKFGYNLGFQLPIRIKPIYVIPNVKFLLGSTFTIKDTEIAFHYGVSGGLQLAYKIHTHSYLLLGLDIKKKKYISSDEYVDKRKDFGFGLNVGITF